MITMVNRIKLLQELKKYPVFGVKTVADVISKSREYAKLVVHRLKKAGLIFELERNRYTTHWDPLLVSSHIIWPCYISGWAAIRYHNMTEQLPRIITIITTRAKKNRRMDFANATLEFVRIKKEFFFGFEKVRYGDFELFMADKEKALADALYLKRITFSEAVDIIKNQRKELNIRKLYAYLKKLGLGRVVKEIKEDIR